MALLFLCSVPLRNRGSTECVSAEKKKIRTACVAAPFKRARSLVIPAGPAALPALDMSPLEAMRTRRLYAPVKKERLRVGSDELLKRQVAPEHIGPAVRTRKPHGYWNQLTNVERELIFVNLQLGRQGRRVMPRVDELKALGRGDLLAGLMKHGGMLHVAGALRWARAPRENGVRVARPVRQKVFRRPTAYWADVQRVHIEMTAFIDEFGVRGVMPTRKQLYAFGRSDLANAAMRHGGLRVIARQMKLKCRKSARPRGYWRDFAHLSNAIVEFSERHCPAKMPTADELSSKGYSCIVNAIAAHGGFPAVAEKCGLFPRNAKRQGAPLVWDEIRVRREYLSFLMTFYPHLAKERVMVGERQLREHGRNDLSYAIGKFGGFGSLAKALGLKKRVFSKAAISKAVAKDPLDS